MRLRAIPPEIAVQNPFENCKLKRKAYAKLLTSIIDNAEGGFTMALNNSWGTGKTTFVKMWQKYLENSEHQTVYVNAWEMDFISDPLYSILGEISSLVKYNKKIKKRFRQILKSLPSSLLIGIKYYADTHLGEKAINNLFKKHKYYDDNVLSYINQRDAIQQFRKELSEFIADICKGQKLIFFIDELDRCRPDYAVEFLERIKHFFSIDNIIFVISVDKKHLEESIKGHYGSSEIDTEEYLRRFFDIEYSLPEPKLKQFCNYIYSTEIIQGIQDERMREILLEIICIISQQASLTPRQIERLIAHLKICYSSYESLLYAPDLAAILFFFKCFHANMYNNLKNSLYSVDDLSKLLSDIFGDDLQKEANKGPYKMSYVVVSLLFRYNIQLGINGVNSLRNYRKIDQIPVLNFKPYKLEQSYAYNLVHDFEKSNNMFSLSEFYPLIDMSFPFTKNELTNKLYSHLNSSK